MTWLERVVKESGYVHDLGLKINDLLCFHVNSIDFRPIWAYFPDLGNAGR